MARPTKTHFEDLLAACDEMAASGIKPTYMRLIAQCGGGSTRVQAALSAWKDTRADVYEQLVLEEQGAPSSALQAAAQGAAVVEVEDIPAAARDFIIRVWRTAFEAASSGVEARETAVSRLRAEIEASAAAAEAALISRAENLDAREAALDERETAADAELPRLRSEVARLAAALAKAEAERDAATARLAQADAEKQQLMTALQSALAMPHMQQGQAAQGQLG